MKFRHIVVREEIFAGAAPLGLWSIFSFTQGLRPGLPNAAPSALVVTFCLRSCVLHTSSGPAEKIWQEEDQKGTAVSAVPLRNNRENLLSVGNGKSGGGQKVPAFAELA